MLCGGAPKKITQISLCSCDCGAHVTTASTSLRSQAAAEPSRCGSLRSLFTGHSPLPLRIYPLQKVSFEHNRSIIKLTADFFGVIGETDVFDHFSALQGYEATFYFQVFDEGYGVTFLKDLAVAVFNFHLC